VNFESQLTDQGNDWLRESAGHLRELYAPLRTKLEHLDSKEPIESENIQTTYQQQSAMGLLCSSFGFFGLNA
jgi:hypothetical protein